MSRRIRSHDIHTYMLYMEGQHDTTFAMSRGLTNEILKCIDALTDEDIARKLEAN